MLNNNITQDTYCYALQLVILPCIMCKIYIVKTWLLFNNLEKYSSSPCNYLFSTQHILSRQQYASATALLRLQSSDFLYGNKKQAYRKRAARVKYCVRIYEAMDSGPKKVNGKI